MVQCRGILNTSSSFYAQTHIYTHWGHMRDILILIYSGILKLVRVSNPVQCANFRQEEKQVQLWKTTFEL